MATTYYTSSASNDVFYYWTTTTSNSTTSGTSDVWESWHTSGTACSGTTSCYTDAVWSSWISTEYTIVEPQKVSPPEPSVETMRAREAQRKIDNAWRDIRIKEEEERKQLAELTAQELLEDLIGGEELALYRETGRLVVPGRKYTYVLKKEGGVYKVEKDKIINLCIHLREKYKYPETDNVISLKAFIEANEYEFLKTANSHGELRDESIRSKVMELVKRAA